MFDHVRGGALGWRGGSRVALMASDERELEGTLEGGKGKMGYEESGIGIGEVSTQDIRMVWRIERPNCGQ